MQHRYAKLKSTGRIVASLSGGNPDIDDLDVFASGVGWPVDQLEVGYESEEVVSGWWEAQNKADRTYVDKRKSEYPPATDYLDGIVKGDQTQIDKYISDCLAIKEKFPKE
jgi:hypothetical protein